MVGPGAPDLGPDFGLAQFSSQEQVVRLAVGRLLLSPNTRANVLCAGAKAEAPGRASLGSLGLGLASEPWRLLLSRIGDTLMLYLLLHCSMWSRVPNGTVVQLTGPPMARIARASVFGRRPEAARAPGAPASAKLEPGQQTMAASQDSTTYLLGPTGIEQEVLPAECQEGPEGPCGPQLGFAGSRPQHAQQARASPFQPAQRLAAMQLPRQLIFYSATFSGRAGLPSQHVLRQLSKQPKKGRHLYSIIFQVRASRCPFGALLEAICPLPAALCAPPPTAPGPTSVRAACTARLEQAMDAVHAALGEASRNAGLRGGNPRSLLSTQASTAACREGRRARPPRRS
ncbi:hypothetical protein APUTEX25_003257 [Auxenochlorella protothecoides]|uniref:Telomerase reverse transcriptase n=1 Tax=Auxenochlorella protothecoides TaxID=3075 RepID=A0A3M7KT64_AUXPR|nr:hypothetical protein APUTEX25_003257 [Auxenochlorella protothecoides]|eukprot:RMZ53723.1 hypothetical protein APUTEX25_003257 [Auxenochlorella protothecoides]